MIPWHDRVPEQYRVAAALLLVPAALLLALVFLKGIITRG